MKRYDIIYKISFVLFLLTSILFGFIGYYIGLLSVEKQCSFIWDRLDSIDLGQTQAFAGIQILQDKILSIIEERK